MGKWKFLWPVGPCYIGEWRLPDLDAKPVAKNVEKHEALQWSVAQSEENPATAREIGVPQ